MQVFAVCGKDNTGKSSVLNDLITWINASDPKAYSISPICGNVYGVVSDGKVTRHVFVWESGDNLWMVNEGIKALQSIADSVDVFIIASRTRGLGYDELSNVFAGSITFLYKSIVDSSNDTGGSKQKCYEIIDNASFLEGLKNFIFS